MEDSKGRRDHCDGQFDRAIVVMSSVPTAMTALVTAIMKFSLHSMFQLLTDAVSYFSSSVFSNVST